MGFGTHGLFKVSSLLFYRDPEPSVLYCTALMHKLSKGLHVTQTSLAPLAVGRWWPWPLSQERLCTTWESDAMSIAFEAFGSGFYVSKWLLTAEESRSDRL
jgi:hypothetical protein